MKRIHKLIILILLVGSPEAWPQSMPLPTIDGGPDSFSPFQFFTNGESVNLTNGNMSMNWTNVVVPGRAGMNLGLTRTLVAGSTELVLEDFLGVFEGAQSAAYKFNTP